MPFVAFAKKNDRCLAHFPRQRQKAKCHQERSYSQPHEEKSWEIFSSTLKQNKRDRSQEDDTNHQGKENSPFRDRRKPDGAALPAFARQEKNESCVFFEIPGSRSKDLV